MTVLSSITSGVIVAVVTIALAGWRFQNEEQAKQTREARNAIRRMAASWSIDVGMFIERQADLPMIPDDDAEKYKMCSAAIEAAHPLPWLTRRAVHRACRILFGRQIEELADRFPFDAFKNQNSFMLAVAMFERGDIGEGGSRQIELGHFGELFVRRRQAKRDGSIAVGSEIPKIEGSYRAGNLLYILAILKEIRWYHTIVLSYPYQYLRAQLRKRRREARKTGPSD